MSAQGSTDNSQKGFDEPRKFYPPEPPPLRKRLDVYVMIQLNPFAWWTAGWEYDKDYAMFKVVIGPFSVLGSW